MRVRKALEQLFYEKNTDTDTDNDTDNMQTEHTNENKQFWPKYKIKTITKMWKYSIFTEKPLNLCI